MNGDLSRFRFDPKKGYSSVRAQQGRVDLHADQNEEIEIRLHDTRAVRSDVIGVTGAPADAPGMAITAAGTDLRVGAGRFYADGVRCDFEPTGGTPVAIGSQPFPTGETLPTAVGLYVVYLDVWERPITAIQDPAIREVALGGPDTATRSQAIWQVKLLKVAAAAATSSCETEFPEWTRLVAGSTGTLEVREAPADATATPCDVPETAGFRGRENQLFRIQIHAGNFDPIAASGASATPPTFKWSQDNGAVVASWVEHPASLELTIDRLGPGGANGFEIGEWVEISHDTDDLALRSGVVAQIDDITGSTLRLADPTGAVATALGAPPANRPAQHSQVRLWSTAAPRATAGDWLEVDQGIQVRFSNGSFRPGDFWTIPARTAALPGTTGRHLEWPMDAAGTTPLAVRPHGIRHHYARLALAERTATTWTLRDCRKIFSPLVDQIDFDGRGGDGQQARSNCWLPAPLIVGVSRGRRPVAGARVQFALPSGVQGGLSGTQPDATGAAAGTSSVLATTNGDGLAFAWWRLGPAPALEAPADRFQPARAQTVTATLLAPPPSTASAHLPVTFVATAVDNLILKPAGGNGQIGKPGETLEVALRVQICDGLLPVAGARVRFSVMNREVFGTPLNESTGGWLIANVPPGQSWPGGAADRHIEAVVQTDAEGIAQVQWRLGEETRLPIQRVEARLLDADGVATKQQTLFTAELALASAIVWTPCPEMLPLLKGAVDVQTALSVFCKLLSSGAAPFRVVPDWSVLVPAVQVESPGSVLTPVPPDAQVVLKQLNRFVLTTHFNIRTTVPPSRPHGLVVEVEVPWPGTKTEGTTVVRLDGTLTVGNAPAGSAPGTRGVRWKPSGAAKDFLKAQLKEAGSNGLRMQIVLIPAYIGSNDFDDPSVRFVRGFWLV